MVFMKKGATPSKNQQVKKGKKPVQAKEVDMDFDEMDDSDDDVDSDEAPQLQRTPANKGAKGRQSMSEKKVSFSFPGKNSPAVKTPKKDTSILAKKQPTPANKGKTGMQEFKGIKGNNQAKKGMDQEDSDEDDEDDDDFDIEEGDDDDDLDDLDIEDEGSDDDEEDDEDDDDDDEDDDDDKEAVQQKLSALKQNNKQKTPVKGNDKAKNAESPKEKTPKKELAQKAASPKQNANGPLIVEELERRRERDAKMLFVGGLPKDIKPEELKALSGDIIDITLPNANKKSQAKTLFGFLAFNSEAKAESNYKTLQSKKLRGQPLTLDFVGEKSSNKKVQENNSYNKKKLFVSGMPVDTTIDKVAKLFPMSYQITFNQSPIFRTAAVLYETEELAKFAYESQKGSEISGHKLVVLYSKQGAGLGTKRKHNRARGGKNNENKNNSFGGHPAKKMKFSKKPVNVKEE